MLSNYQIVCHKENGAVEVREDCHFVRSLTVAAEIPGLRCLVIIEKNRTFVVLS